MKKTILLSLFLIFTFVTSSCDNELEDHWHKLEEIGSPVKQNVFQGNWVDVQGNISVISAAMINIVSETVSVDFQISENARYRYPVNHLGYVYQIKDGNFFLEIEFKTKMIGDKETINYDEIIVRYNGEEVELSKQ